MLIDYSITGFLAELKSDSPAPGGGSAAALVGAIGAALGIMVGNLTISSAKYEAVHEESRKLALDLEECLAALEQDIDKDTAAFTQVMKVYKLPKSTDEEKRMRSQAIQEALKAASNLPFEVAKACLNVLELSERMLSIGNVNAASDAAVAGRMAQAAMWSAIYNVRINLGSIKDTDFVSDMKGKVEGIVARSEVLMAQLVKIADEKI
ncbi:formiminotetrahydrofolate cyclodeaminase [Sporomusaceae bacterium BoRhaA]|uniref:cyclodeaminase/cyclohydrolase family protein n=1 Tax=Pelorhabdus rhamnosifermentans TaxID=2772457 RepID=UPI001C060522|nr:cyclodeaminase/cyclohydrolase family protein [Pelorhabdus rhamnosifermentans]MBU2699402.1 formiminotetrahydrofolate cyclodeaminase [Pelorhabdus rhamnosifermentans]